MVSRWWRLAAASVSLVGFSVFGFGFSAFIAPIEEEYPSLPRSLIPYISACRACVFAAWNLLAGQKQMHRGAPAMWVLVSLLVTVGGVLIAALSVSGAEPSVWALVLGLAVLPGVRSFFAPTPRDGTARFAGAPHFLVLKCVV